MAYKGGIFLQEYNHLMLQLLRTKISIPPMRPNRVERARLMDRVRAGMSRALTLVVAPAGFGKTTLMAECAQSGAMPTAWLSLERADRAAPRFLSYFIHSIQTISPKTGQTALAMLQSGQAVSDEAVLYALLNDLNEIPQDFAILLDDYHCVDEAEINALIQHALEHAPARMHLAIASRVIPNLSLARLRALDQLTEISAADLRFNEEEMRAFLEQMGASLTPEQALRLNRSTEGWAVGLQLAALALARQPHDWTIPAGQTHIFDYLAEEVVRREPPHVQDFLLKTALFDRFNVQLCERLFADEEPPLAMPAPDLLNYVERSNLFLVPLDAAGSWFRYHALFADFLRQRLTLHHPDSIPRLHHTASLWFEQNGFPDDAIHYAVHAHDFERAANLLEANYRDMLQRGEQANLMEWLSALPEKMVNNRPLLLLAKGWANIISLETENAEAIVNQVEALIPPDETGDRLRGEARALRILAGVFQGRVPPAEEFSETFVLLSEQDDFLHTLLHFNLGLSNILSGNPGEAVEAFAEAERLAEKLNVPLIAIVAGVQKGEQLQICGELAQAERAFQKVIRYARETLGERTFLLGMPFVSYADLLREQNRFDEAIRYAEQGIALCQVWQPMASIDGQLALARLEAGRGAWQDSFARFAEAMQTTERTRTIMDDTFVGAQWMRAYLLQGDLMRAQTQAQTHQLEEALPAMYYHLREMVTLSFFRADILRAERDPLRAAQIADEISKVMPEIERRKRMTYFIEASILRAYALHAAGKHAEAAQSLSSALQLGARCGYLRLFADEGARLLHLLEQYRARLTDLAPYLDMLFSLMRGDSPRSVAPRAADLTPLTRRELDILRLLADGKSNAEIAAELVLALNTVKKHVANILDKSGTANRTQAVTVARERGWLK